MKNFEVWLLTPNGETKYADTWTMDEATDKADGAVIGRIDCRAVVIRSSSSPLSPVLYAAESN